jgi:hypothetical protein
MNKNLIIAILVIVIIGIAAFMVFSHNGTTDSKINTQMNMLSGSSLQNGEQIQFELKDEKGNALSGQMVDIGFTDGAGNNETFKIVTDANGKGYLEIENEDAGSHNFTAVYAGNGNYSGSTLTETITIEDSSSDDDSDTDSDESYDSSTANSNQTSDSGSSSSNTSEDYYDQGYNLKYDDETGLYYDADGKVRGGQADGMSIDEIKKNGGDPYKGIN